MLALEVRSLAKRFGRVRAVRDVSLAVERGQVYGLVGPNGSGKTTTMACALGLLRPDAGEARVLGVPAPRIHETRGRVAALFDAATLVPGLTARQNLEYAARLLGHRGGRGVDEALERTGLARLAGQRAGGLSLGQSRRLSIARVLLGGPELVVLDEPLSGLDTVGVIEVLELFRELAAAGVTLVLSSHRMHEMERVVTRVGVILDGELVREASLTELLARGDGAVVITATPAGRAREVLEGLAAGPVEELRRGTSRTDSGTDGGADETGELRVGGGAERSGELNRALVEAGVVVSGLVPERATLHGVFEELLDEQARRAREAANRGPAPADRGRPVPSGVGRREGGA